MITSVGLPLNQAGGGAGQVLEALLGEGGEGGEEIRAIMRFKEDLAFIRYNEPSPP
jgi:hypothetical protein